ncbi:ABC transporter G family member 25 [Capsicum chinense]|uniref:ABC transporter G family member 25 n=1 Tax=Capsicum annuum TaxID=4072 RepID=A0A1U8GMW2_CAPAN|nr:ABC transporter G family member 25 [Capsicum annuum]PHT83584.1 ABC transporter G family member 25 [Capsicum annuum]PHU19823.1 ABC transporter G family member 25 [Capsicum chinense]
MPVTSKETTTTMNATTLTGEETNKDFPFVMSSSTYPITLTFMDVSYRIKLENKSSGGSSNLRKMFSGGPTSSTDIENPTATIHQERTVLNGITGMVSPGEILAVLGPSGSGKSTLLNALAGRLQGHSYTGTILANNRKLSKHVLKRTGFVTQDDILYPHLTVRETLIFCALLRLPNSLNRKEKIAITDSVITELGLNKCEDTIIGNSFIRRGVSGGERKRVSIAHEMLINPSLLILDEPTSGLDATAAYRLVSTLGSLAQKGKTIITSVHQPSSRVFQMFNSVLVLSEGRCLYFGKGNESMNYFESVGFSPSFPMNPADFLLDLANGVCQFDGVSEKEKPNVKQTLGSTYNKSLAPKVKAACLDTIDTVPKEVLHTGTYSCSSSKRTCTNYVSDWFNQFSILLQRGLKERKHETFNYLRVFQVIAASLLAGSMWWHSDYRDIQDRLGLLFFISIFWGVFPSFNAVFAFPQERAIFVKERASGMYTLSSYFMARIVGDLPMDLILPTFFLIITYWMAGLKPQLLAFLLTLLVLLGYVVVSQGFGLAFGAIIMDAKQASTVITVMMLAFVLTGGFYVHKVPACLAWIKYISTTFYCYRLLIYVQFGEGQEISDLLGCSHQGSDRASCKFIEQDVKGQIHPSASLGILLIMFIGYRLIAYLALRRIRT